MKILHIADGDVDRRYETAEFSALAGERLCVVVRTCCELVSHVGARCSRRIKPAIHRSLLRAVDEDDVDRARTRRTGLGHLDVNTPFRCAIDDVL